MVQPEPPPVTDSEPYLYPVWQAGRQAGWITTDEPLERANAYIGTFHPDPEAFAVKAVLEAAAAAWRAYQDAPNPPPPEAATDPICSAEREAKLLTLRDLYERHEEALAEVEALGLSAGDPPIRMRGLTIDGWGVNFYAAEELSRSWAAQGTSSLPDTNE